jgi:L-2-hydroxyglutarate oxidase LhgO
MAAGKYDFIIVGAGVIGCAIARELARSRCRTLVLEAALDVGEGASKANSSILHTGFDTKPGTLESRLVTEGWQLWQEEADELHLPLQQVGALMLALDDRELLQLEHWWTTAHRNGVTDVERLSPEAVRERYPLAPSCVRGGLLIPRESITCTMTAVIALAEQAAINGVEFVLGARVLGFEPTNGAQRTVLTTRGAFTARWVIDAAGLWADEVAAWAGVNDFHLTPRKGEFLILDKTARTKVPCILLPVPSEVSKGILVTPTVYGNVLLGPTADDISDKHDRTVSLADCSVPAKVRCVWRPTWLTNQSSRPMPGCEPFTPAATTRSRSFLANGLSSLRESVRPASLLLWPWRALSCSCCVSEESRCVPAARCSLGRGLRGGLVSPGPAQYPSVSRSVQAMAVSSASVNW